MLLQIIVFFYVSIGPVLGKEKKKKTSKNLWISVLKYGLLPVHV